MSEPEAVLLSAELTTLEPGKLASQLIDFRPRSERHAIVLHRVAPRVPEIDQTSTLGECARASALRSAYSGARHRPVDGSARMVRHSRCPQIATRHDRPRNSGRPPAFFVLTTTLGGRDAKGFPSCCICSGGRLRVGDRRVGADERRRVGGLSRRGQPATVATKATATSVEGGVLPVQN